MKFAKELFMSRIEEINDRLDNLLENRGPVAGSYYSYQTLHGRRCNAELRESRRAESLEMFERLESGSGAVSFLNPLCYNGSSDWRR